VCFLKPSLITIRLSMKLTSPVISLLFIGLVAPASTRSQEVECTVHVNYEAVASTYQDLLQDFRSDISTYINGYRWGPDQLDEKIQCTVDIFISGSTGDNRYSAQAFIGSKRKILGSGQSSAVVRVFDESWEFTYVQNRPIVHNFYGFNDLASFLDFYVLLVIGYDYDTYDNLLGTPFFQKAADVANLGRNSGKRGWQENSSGTYNRVRLIDEILNAKFAPVRTASYTYHFAGLDSLQLNPQRGYGNMLRAIESIGKVRRQADPRNQIIKVFFDTKYLEIAEQFLNYPDRAVYITFARIDPGHQTTYEEYMQRSR
jgi:Domain of unknown function (DUF4835)